ncbi:MAG: GlcNAc-PI de-N-acetylase [Chloroflexota bacterium]|nr:MAG: GlcNAc-PI de-N-acetylase [Chloroflexota bacterium]
MDKTYPDKAYTLLAVLAHPDDESFGMGGTLALYARRGVQVHLVCATRGEVGEVDEEHMNGYQTIADLRVQELRCAAEKLGLAGVHFLDYRDSGMPGSPENLHPKSLVQAPLDQAAKDVAHYIRMLKPQVVITFDPIGGYRHPDHIAVHNATVRAFHIAGDANEYPGELPPYQPQKLYFHTFSRRFFRIALRLMPLFGINPRRFGRNHDIDLTTLAIEDFPVNAQIDYREVAEAKAEASACHASQEGPQMRGGIMGLIFRLIGDNETYMRAYPDPEERHIERDLFSGVNVEETQPETSA